MVIFQFAMLVITRGYLRETKELGAGVARYGTVFYHWIGSCFAIWKWNPSCCVSENVGNTPKPNGFADHYPVFQWLAIIGNINPTFSDKPILSYDAPVLYWVKNDMA